MRIEKFVFTPLDPTPEKYLTGLIIVSRYRLTYERVKMLTDLALLGFPNLQLDDLEFGTIRDSRSRNNFPYIRFDLHPESNIPEDYEIHSVLHNLDINF